MTGIFIALRRLIEVTPCPDATRQDLLRSINDELVHAQRLQTSSHYLAGLRSAGMAVAGS